MGDPSGNAKSPDARANSRSRRRVFPGAAPTTPLPELPDEPLPPEPVEHEAPSPGPEAPIVLIPVGQIDVAAFEVIRRPLEDIYQRRTEIGGPLPVPKYAYNPTREQYHLSAILKRVEEARLPEWDAAVGITEADLFVPDEPFRFGDADRSTRAALISLRRIRAEAGAPDMRREITGRRFISEVIHQVGLIRGLAHCPNNRCVMYYPSAVNDIDKRGSSLCANCRKRLQAAD